VEIVRREYAAFAARDWAALADLCHPDIEYETLKTAPGVHGHYRGLHEITQFFDSWAELYAEFRVEAVEIVDAGDQVVTVERHAARGLKGSNAEAWIRDTFACLISFRRGKIWRIEEFPTLEEALEAAGRGYDRPASRVVC
jgi:ketosteroid isomerase-like protein